MPAQPSTDLEDRSPGSRSTTIGAGTSGTIKNNIIVNNLGSAGSGEGAVGVYAASGSSQFSAINYNNYYCAASSGSNSVGKIGGLNYGTLSAFQGATGQDANSSSTNVTFFSSSDLRLTGGSNGDPLLMGTGVGVTTDIEGDPRDATNPYMGADEADSPLPITLAEFFATIESGTHHVRLNWATLSEVNNFGFFVQRRQGDEGPFVEIAGSFVKGNGTTTLPQQYTYLDATVTPGIWYYRLKQIDLDGIVHLSEPVQVGVVTGVEEQVPLEYALAQNYPNPFNPSTTIAYELPKTSQVRLEVYDALGQLVGTLVDREQDPGRYMVQLKADDLSAGVYFYRLQAGAGDFAATKKLLLVK